MKKRFVILEAAALLLATASFAQSVEYDDMYFNSKDREKLKAQKASEQQLSYQQTSKKKQADPAEEYYADNKDYSARNENPEFAARSNAQAAADDAEYFAADYRYNNVSNLNRWNNNYNNWYNSSWAASSYWGPGLYGWNSPYYGGFYDTWGSPWMNPYRSGWSSSFGFHWGSSWNYGWGNNWGWGMGMAYGNPYMNSWYGGWGPSFGYGWGGGWGRGWYGYPSVVVINNEYGRNASYGKRGTQGGIVTRQQGAVNSRTRPSTTPSDGSRPTYNSSTGGRVATNATVPSRGQSQGQDDYYNRNWRNSRQGDAYSAPSYSQPSRSGQTRGWDNGSTQWNRSGGNNARPDAGRSGYSGGNTRSSAPASTGSNGRTRGRD